MKRRRNNLISGQFSARLTEMLASPAYRVLSRAAHMILARIEIEHGNHGGNDNGRLPVTFDDFEQYGVERHAIAPALREVEALGFIEITERGRQGQANRRRPNYYRLTYRPLPTDAKGDGTHEWRRFQAIDAAKMAAKKARQKSESLVRVSPVGSGETPLKQSKSRGKSPPPRRGESHTTIYISGEDTAQQAREVRPSKGAVASGLAGHDGGAGGIRDDLIQSRIADRLGGGVAGWSILQAIPDDVLVDVIEAERCGALSDDVVLALRQKFHQRGAA